MTLYYIQLGEGFQFFGPFKTEAEATRKMRRLKIVGAKIVKVTR